MKGNAVYDWHSFKRIYTGKSGCGKTTLFWQDWCREKARLKLLYDHKAMEFCIKHDLEPIFDFDTLLSEIARVIENGKCETLAFVPSKLYPGEPDKGFEVFCDLVFGVCQEFKGRKLLGADELQKLVGVHAQPKPLLNLCDEGRTAQIDCFFAASATNRIHNLVRNQITECYAFLHGSSSVCEWEVEFGFQLNELLELKKGEWLWRNDAGEDRRGGKAFQTVTKAG